MGHQDFDASTIPSSSSELFTVYVFPSQFQMKPALSLFWLGLRDLRALN